MSSADIQRAIEAAQKKLKIWQQRLTAVQEAKGYFQNNIDDYVEEFNKKIEKAQEDFFYGYMGFSNSGTVAAEISDLQEAYLNPGYSDITASLNKEISCCNTKISELQATIRELQIALEEAIAAEQAALAAEQKKPNESRSGGGGGSR